MTLTALLFLPEQISVEECERLMELRNIPSRYALAKKAQMDPRHLSRVLDQEIDPTLGTLNKIAAALQVRVRDILINDEPDEDPT